MGNADIIRNKQLPCCEHIQRMTEHRISQQVLHCQPNDRQATERERERERGQLLMMTCGTAEKHGVRILENVVIITDLRLRKLFNLFSYPIMYPANVFRRYIWRRNRKYTLSKEKTTTLKKTQLREGIRHVSNLFSTPLAYVGLTICLIREPLKADSDRGFDNQACSLRMFWPRKKTDHLLIDSIVVITHCS